MTSLFIALIMTYYTDGTTDELKPKFYRQVDCDKYISHVIQRKEDLVLDGNNIWSYKKIHRIIKTCVKENK